MIEHLTYNSNDKFAVSAIGFMVEPMAVLYIFIGFCLGSITTYLLNRYERK